MTQPLIGQASGHNAILYLTKTFHWNNLYYCLGVHEIGVTRPFMSKYIGHDVQCNTKVQVYKETVTAQFESKKTLFSNFHALLNCVVVLWSIVYAWL